MDATWENAEAGDVIGKPKRRTPLSVFAAVGPFSDDLISGGHGLRAAVERLSAMTPLDAVRLLLAASRRTDSVIDDRELDDLAEELGVFEEEEP